MDFEDIEKKPSIISRLIRHQQLPINSIQEVYGLENKENDFNSILQKMTHQFGEEIKEICALNHEMFLKSVEELLRVKAKTANLKKNLISLNEQVQETGK